MQHCMYWGKNYCSLHNRFQNFNNKTKRGQPFGCPLFVFCQVLFIYLKLIAFNNSPAFVSQLKNIETTENAFQGNAYFISINSNRNTPAPKAIVNLYHKSLFYWPLYIESDKRTGGVRVKFHHFYLCSTLPPTFLSKGTSGKKTKDKYGQQIFQ